MPLVRPKVVARTRLARRQLAFLILLYLLALWLAATAMRGEETPETIRITRAAGSPSSSSDTETIAR